MTLTPSTFTPTTTTGSHSVVVACSDTLFSPTGGTVTDIDGDGQLELLLAHGESVQQPISVFRVAQVCVCMWV